jgi:hypothetical protein
VQRAPGFPCALGFSKGGSDAKLGRFSAARTRTHILSLFDS